MLGGGGGGGVVLTNIGLEDVFFLANVRTKCELNISLTLVYTINMASQDCW